MRWWQAVLLLVIAALAGLATGNRIFLIAAIALFIVLAISLYYRQKLGQITGRRVTTRAVVPWGEQFEHRILVHNPSLLPVSAVRVLDETSLPGQQHGFVAGIAPRRDVHWTLDMACYQRGRYQVGPTIAHMSDPMGLFAVDRQVAEATSVLVLPRWAPLRRSALKLDGLMAGEARSKWRGESPPAVSSIREYSSGDSLAAIHWPASARAGRLMSKLFDPEVQTTLWLILDLEEGMSTAREEALVVAAASLGLYALRQLGLRLGALSGGAWPFWLNADRGRAQEARLLERLASVRAGDKLDLPVEARARERYFAPGHVVTLFTQRKPETWEPWLRYLEQRGIAPRVIVMGDEAATWNEPTLVLADRFADPAYTLELVHTLEGS